MEPNIKAFLDELAAIILAEWKENHCAKQACSTNRERKIRSISCNTDEDT